MTSIRVVAAAVMLAGTSAGGIAPAAAAPIGQSLAATAPTSGLTEQVYWRGRGWGWGAGAFVGGLAAGALIAPYYYGYPYYYGPGYYAAPGYGPPPEGDAEAYCMHRYKSYDPNTGTFLGKDGHRHPCP